MKDGINESHSESANSHHFANKKRKINELSDDANKSHQHLQDDLIEAQQKIAKLEGSLKHFRTHIQNEIIQTANSGLLNKQNLVIYLSTLSDAGILPEIDFNFTIEQAPYAGMTLLQMLLDGASRYSDLSRFLKHKLILEDKIQSFDFSVAGPKGTALFILLNELGEVELEKRNSLGDDHFLQEELTILTELLETIFRKMPLEDLEFNNKAGFENSVTETELLVMLAVCIEKDKLERVYPNWLASILNEVPLLIDLNFHEVTSEIINKSKYIHHFNFIRKLQEINKALGEPDEIENAEEPQKSVEQLMVEAEALAKTAEENGYNSAYYWLSKVLQSEFYNNHPTMEYLDQWRRMAKKIPKNHPEYIDIHRTLADEYRVFLTERENALSVIPKVDRSTDQQEEFEALQRPKLLTAFRAAGRIKENDTEGKALYYRLAFMLARGIDEIVKTQDPQFEATLDKLSSSSKKECASFFNINPNATNKPALPSRHGKELQGDRAENGGPYSRTRKSKQNGLNQV